jgi:hypothetical protein
MEKETTKLLNLLRGIARATGPWRKSDPELARFCVSQYNKVLARLSEIEPAIVSVFTPLAEEASAEVAGIAARELLAYFDPDRPDLFTWSFGRPFAFRCRPRSWRTRCYAPQGRF